MGEGVMLKGGKTVAFKVIKGGMVKGGNKGLRVE